MASVASPTLMYTVALACASFLPWVHAVDVSTAMINSGPQVMIHKGAQVAACNGTWYATRGPQALGISLPKERTRAVRVITPSDAASRASPPGADEGGCGLLPVPWEPQQRPGTLSRWRWGDGMPGGTWASGRSPASRGLLMPGCTLDPATGAYGLDCLSNTTLSAPDASMYPAAASRQEPPYAAGLSPRSSALLPPTRSVEPWTTEEWVFIFEQGGSWLNHGGGAGLTAGYFRYHGVPEAGEDARPWSPLPLRPRPSQWPYGLGHNAVFGAFDVLMHRTASFHMPMMRCPAVALSPACTPLDVPIGPNDTCRQATAWNPPPSDVPQGACDGLYTRPDLSNASAFAQRREVELVETTRAFHVVSPPGTRAFPFGTQGTGLYNRWHQLLTVVYPPGTVAELALEAQPPPKAPPHAASSTNGGNRHVGPAGEGSTGGAAGQEASYPWRVNRGFVVQVVMNVAPVSAMLRLGAGSPLDVSDSGSVMCDVVGRPFFHAPSIWPQRAAMVVLDNPSCVSARNCTPTVPWDSSAGSEEQLQAVRLWIRESYFRRPAGMRIPRFGCSMTHFLDNATSMDLIHFDYPAAASTRAASLGGEGMPETEPVVGTWSPPRATMATAGATNAPPAAGKGAPPSAPGQPRPRASSGQQAPAPTPWSVGVNPSILQGPVARYRGAALWRVTAPSPERSLPAIEGGSWQCMETSPLGAYFMRPVCRAECGDPSRIATADEWLGPPVGRPGVRDGGPVLTASLARPWLSRWGGYPALAQSESVAPRPDRWGGGLVASFGGWENRGEWAPPLFVGPMGQTAPTSMRCVPDQGSSLSWDAPWAQREPAGRAEVQFSLVFDRSSWPPAQTSVAGGSIGLDYPQPSVVQLRRLRAEIAADVGDLLGEVDWTARGRGLEVGIGERLNRTANRTLVDQVRDLSVQILSISTPPPVQQGDSARESLRPNSSIVPPVLPMTIRVLLLIPELPVVRFASPDDTAASQRGRSAGALAQQLGAILRGEWPGAEGGAWLPAASETSVAVAVKLPCLHGGYGTGPAACGRDMRAMWRGLVGGLQVGALGCLLVGLLALWAGRAWRRAYLATRGELDGGQALAADIMQPLVDGGTSGELGTGLSKGVGMDESSKSGPGSKEGMGSSKDILASSDGRDDSADVGLGMGILVGGGRRGAETTSSTLSSNDINELRAAKEATYCCCSA